MPRYRPIAVRGPFFSLLISSPSGTRCPTTVPVCHTRYRVQCPLRPSQLSVLVLVLVRISLCSSLKTCGQSANLETDMEAQATRVWTQRMQKTLTHHLILARPSLTSPFASLIFRIWLCHHDVPDVTPSRSQGAPSVLGNGFASSHSTTPGLVFFSSKSHDCHPP